MYIVIPGQTRFNCASLGFTGVSWVLPSFTGFLRFLHSFTGIGLFFTVLLLGFDLLLPKLNQIDQVSLVFTVFLPPVWPCFFLVLTKFYLILLSFHLVFTRFYLVFIFLPRFLLVLPGLIHLHLKGDIHRFFYSLKRPEVELRFYMIST